MNELELNLELKPNPEPMQVCIVINPQAQSIYFLTFCNQSHNKYINEGNNFLWDLFTLVDLAIDAKAVKATSFNICFPFWITQNSTAEIACN